MLKAGKGSLAEELPHPPSQAPPLTQGPLEGDKGEAYQSSSYYGSDTGSYSGAYTTMEAGALSEVPSSVQWGQ